MPDKLFSVDDCDNFTNKEVRELYKKYVNPSLEQLFGHLQLVMKRLLVQKEFGYIPRATEKF